MQIEATRGPGVAGRVIEVSGSDPRERGRQYGEAAAREITRSIQYYAELFARDHQVTWPEIADRALVWEAEIERFDADLAEEVRGIAEGAGRSRGEMVYGKYMPRQVEGCTSFAVLPEASADSHMYGGQNWDWRAATSDTWVVLRVVQPPKSTVITVVEAGQVGRHGANSAGLALFANGLGGFCSPEPRVPQPFIRRRILDSGSCSEALEVALSAPQQIAANLLLAHRDGFAIDLESTPGRRAWLYPGEGMIVHGNHYEAFTWARDGDQYRPYGADSLYRVWRVREGLKWCRTPAGEGVPAAIETALRDHFGFPASVCTHPFEGEDSLQQWQTLTSSIIDLTTGEWRLAAGPPCSHAFETLPWNLYA